MLRAYVDICQISMVLFVCSEIENDGIPGVPAHETTLLPYALHKVICIILDWTVAVAVTYNV